MESAKHKAKETFKDLDKNAPWIEKYRPRTLDDVAAHKAVIDTIKKLVSKNQLPHLLFFGPPGTGKTSTVLAIARQIYGPSMANMVLELNASDDRGIGVVREQIVDFASTQSLFSNKFKLVILDECDAMTKDAQFALRRVIEKYTRNTRFCLICNYVGKIIPALQSRCTGFRFPPLDDAYVESRLSEVCQHEGVKLGEGGLSALVTLGGGDMRRSLNILQTTHMAFGEVTETAVYLCTGDPLPKDMEEIATWLFNEDFSTCFSGILDRQIEKGLALVDIIRDLHPLLEIKDDEYADLPSGGYNFAKPLSIEIGRWVVRVGMPSLIRAALVQRLAEVENNLAASTSEKLQLGALIDGFITAREGIAAAAK